MNTRNLRLVLMPAMLVLVGGLVPASTAAQTVLGPEYTVTKSNYHSLERGEHQCEYFLWTKLGGDVQRVGFNYATPDGKADDDTPRLENVTIILNPARTVPIARISGLDDSRQTLWRLEMSQETYDANKACLQGVTVAPVANK
jgi:hypothetical protein